MTTQSQPAMIPSHFITKWTARGFGGRHAAQICFLNLVNENYEPRPLDDTNSQM